MTPRRFFEMAQEEGVEDYEICLSRFILVDKNEELTGILDVPVHGMATSEDTKEVRFLIITDDVNEVHKCLGDTCKLITIDELKELEKEFDKDKKQNSEEDKTAG